MSEKDDILKVVEWSILQAKKIIPYSAYYPHETENHHQELVLNLVRYQPINIFDEWFYEEIASWHLDISSQAKHPLADSEYYIPYLNQYLSVEEIQEKITGMQPTHSFYTGFRRYEVVAQKALRFGIGNRLEASIYAFLLLLEYPCENPPVGLPKLNKNIRIEFAGFTRNTDCLFFIVNRTKGEIYNPLSWNDDAIIADPLMLECFTKDVLVTQPSEKRWNIYKIFHEGIQKDRTFPEGEDVFVGINHDLKLYSPDWFKKPFLNPLKYWQPQRLMDIKDREAFTFKEDLPRTRPSFIKYILALKELNEEQICELKNFFSICKMQKIEGDTPIIFFAKKERWDIISIFADEPMHEQEKAQYQELLLLALRANQRNLAIRLVKANVKIHFCSNGYDGFHNPLHHAVHTNDGELLTELLKSHPLQSCMQKNNLGETPIAMAARFEKWELVKLFLAHYFVKNEQYDEEYDNVLLCAMHVYQRDIALMLLPSRTKINYYENETQNNLLHYAVHHRDTELLILLLQKDKSLAYRRNKNNETPIELAKRIFQEVLPVFECAENELKKNTNATSTLQKIGSPIFSAGEDLQKTKESEGIPYNP